MTQKILMREVEEDKRYESKDGWTMTREYGETPNGNPLGGRWVLRHNGNWVDFDQYRNDLACHYNLEFVHVDEQ